MTERPQQSSLRTFVYVSVTELVLCALMIGVFALAGYFSFAVCYSAAVGAALSLLNFGVMTYFLYRAEKSETVEKAQLYARGTFGIRMVILAVVLIFILKTGAFNTLATLLPLCFTRIAIFVVELFRKKGETQV